MKNIFKQLIKEFIERDIVNLVHRDYDIPLDSSKIVSLIGVRRSGKTSILFNTIKELRKNISCENIIYINFEDDRLYPLGLKDLDLLVQAYYELYPAKRDEKVYFFLDEVQNVLNWEKFVRRIYDTLNLRIYVTGSSSKLLSSEISTSLRGRTLVYEIFPFSFAEYLKYRGINVDMDSPKSMSFINHALEEYLTHGGFAETINDKKNFQKILRDYLDLIVYKDIVERYNIQNRALLKHLNKYCFTNIATLLSFNKLYNEYKSLGYKLGKDTIYEYISYLEDAYAVFTISIFTNNIKQEQRNPKKIYAIDNGFKKLFNFSISSDFSKLYENIVFLELRRQTKDIYYFKQKQEVDFYVKSFEKEYLINVSYSIQDHSTKEREIKGLVEAMDYLNMQESYLITKDMEENIRYENKTIFVIPLYKWLLKGI